MRNTDHTALHCATKPEENGEKPLNNTVEFRTWHLLNTNQKLCLLTQCALCSKFQCKDNIKVLFG